MSILRKLAGAFVELDEKPTEKKSSGPVPVDRMPTTITLNNWTPPTDTADNEETAHFKELFRKILEDENKRNYPGNDYFEFVVMKNAMKAIPQEDVRYRGAFEGWMTGGNQSKDSLLSTAQIYLGLVDREIKEFGEAYQQEYQQQVLKNEELIAKKTEEVRKYTELLAKLNAEISSLKYENEASSAKLESKHKAFMAAGESQRKEILSEIDKIKQYIS